jgi:hypothetical protein
MSAENPESGNPHDDVGKREQDGHCEVVENLLSVIDNLLSVIESYQQEKHRRRKQGGNGA